MDEKRGFMLWNLGLLVVLVLTNVCPDVEAIGQFYGASMSNTVEPQADGNSKVIIEIVTGWVLGQGPCGPKCSKADVGRSTRSTRSAVISLGRFTYEYQKNKSIITYGLDARMKTTYNETVTSVNHHWEQETMYFSVIMEKDTQVGEIRFDGLSWKNLTLQSSNLGIVSWHLQTRASSKIRSDTNTTNHTPRFLIRPFYRVKLDKVSKISIPTVDIDGDFIECQISRFVEGGSISLHPPPNISVYANCTIFINASKSGGYTNNTWIAVPVTVRDYNREPITHGDDILRAGKFPLSSSTVQFAVQVVENLFAPTFVEPTVEFNHIFIIYVGSTWSTEIYAEAPEYSTIHEFKAFGMSKENMILQNPIQHDLKRPRVSYTTISWKPSSTEVGYHVVCASVHDSNGVDSKEDICYSIEVRTNIFNHSSSFTPGKPYFVDTLSQHQMISCEIYSSCLIPLYVKSNVNVSDIHMTGNVTDKYQVGKVHSSIHNGEKIYEADLSIEPSNLGDKKICLLAKDLSGTESEIICIAVQVEPTDMCFSNPCLHGGTCQTDRYTGELKCLCHYGTSGKFCEHSETPCNPNPCLNNGMCYQSGKCYCRPSSGFSGNKCEININDCPLHACNNHGICKDGINKYSCECFDRYSGANCTIDKCPGEDDKVMTCREAGCMSNFCSGRGLCSTGGQCTCPYGYYGHQCETPKCDITGTSTGVISPSAIDGSQLVCYSQGDMISSCSLRVYFTGKPSDIPAIELETSKHLKNITTVGSTKKSSVLPGISTVYSTDIKINGMFNSTDFQFVCLVAKYIESKSSVCYDIQVVANPEADPHSNAYSRRDTKIKFVQPTMQDSSQIFCTAWERCQILLYTSIASNRTSCSATSVVTPSGSVNGTCDIEDIDNDEFDKNVKVDSPCCEKVISSSAEVKVFPTHPRGPSCVTEATAVFVSVGEKEICFQSTSSSSEGQQLCYKVLVYANDREDPCSSSPCKNNGHCFRTDQDNFKCVCPDNYEEDTCQKDLSTNRTETICFSCDDLSDPSLCDTIERCHSGQICFVESYSLSNGKIHYRSGCKGKQTCSHQSMALGGTTDCLECCENNFCNIGGCGGTAMPPRQSRGPLCLDCAHVRDPKECDQITFCSSEESCSIEKLKWGEEHLYHLGCERTPTPEPYIDGINTFFSQCLWWWYESSSVIALVVQCPSETSSRAIYDQSFETRSVPVCRSCCQDDFCNQNCTKQSTDNQQIIIG